MLGFVTAILTITELPGLVCGLTGFRQACGVVGIGGAPSHDEQAAWDTIPTGDCAALRRFAQAYPNGVLGERARQRVAVALPTTTEQWEPRSYRLALTVRRSEAVSSGLDAARAEALRRAPEEAGTVCSPYGQTDGFRLRGAEPEVVSWRCIALAGGASCGFDGFARCDIEERSRIAGEVCP